MSKMKSREMAVGVFNYALNSVLPEALIKESVRLKRERLIVGNEEYDLERFDNIHILGSGKASFGMARAIEDILGSRIKDGFVVSDNSESSLERVDFFESSHPVPTEKSIKAAEILVERLSRLSKNDLFIYLLSGGTSALIEKLIQSVKLVELQETTNLLLENGVPIEEVNVVRKHISMIKGGKLGGLTKARGIVLVISDVIGDDIETIGSAPLYQDSSSYKDAYDILARYDIWDKIPESVKNVIERGLNGRVEETPKKANRNMKHILIGNNSRALGKAKEKAEELGLRAEVLNSRLKGEAREVAREIVSMGEEILKTSRSLKHPTCLLFGGETTVTLRGEGKGGRNQEMCLSALKEIGDNKNIVFLSAGTDGIDGNSKAAGAVVDYTSYVRAKKLNLCIDEYLNNNDSYNFFKQTGDLIITGPTGTNVMDITILLVKQGDGK
ncbi:MAG: glycerate kinase [Candidatus Altiarchaeota archaeon]|nr:glycerate kinase [Candidatus Altiarchaeota archaeon]